MKKNLSILLLFFVFCCTLAPTYKKPLPSVNIDEISADNEKENHKSSQISQNNNFSNNFSWRDFFQNEEVRNLIYLALNHNRDIKNAALNIQNAKANYNLARSNYLPQIDASASRSERGVPAAFSRFTATRQYQASLNLSSFELDLFGRITSLNRAAIENLYSIEAAEKALKINVISETANLFTEVLLNYELSEIAKNKQNLQKEKLAIIEKRHQNEIDSKEVYLSEIRNFELSAIEYQNYLNDYQASKNALKQLVGIFNNDIIDDNLKLENISFNEKLLESLKSENLLSRPDIISAEHLLKAANADIGAVRAAFFPSITITGNYGYGSIAMTDLFNSKSWSYTPSINLPIFRGGANVANLKIAENNYKIALNNYQKTIENSFKEVLDELSNKKKVDENLSSNSKILSTSEQNLEIAKRKFELEIISQLILIDREISFLDDKISYLNAKKDKISNSIMLFKKLGAREI
jgi:NodT family efflux transporter outer membrane factor (OMF) lipoprotein